MRTGWQRLGVGRKQVRKISAVPAVALGRGGLEAVGRGRIASAQHPATTRRLARSTANQSHTLCRLRPTNVPISSSSSASQRFCSAFFGRRRGSAGLACCAFLPVWPPSCARRPSPARCCVANHARLTTFLPSYSALLARLRRAQTGPGARNHCSGSGHARRCGRCDEFARCRIWRTYVESLPSTLYEIHPALYHRPYYYHLWL